MKKLALLLAFGLAFAGLPGCIGPMGSVEGAPVDVDGATGLDRRPVDVRGAVGPSATPADWSDVPSC